MIGEHHEVVWPAGYLSQPLQPFEQFIQTLQDPQGILARNPGVMGDLIVANEGCIHGRKGADHIPYQSEDAQLPQDCSGHGPDEWIESETVDARPLAPGRLNESLNYLLYKVKQEDPCRPGQHIGIGKE